MIMIIIIIHAIPFYYFYRYFEIEPVKDFSFLRNSFCIMSHFFPCNDLAQLATRRNASHIFSDTKKIDIFLTNMLDLKWNKALL